MSNVLGQTEVKFETLTPVPPLPQLAQNGSNYGSLPNNSQIYGFPGGPHPMYISSHVQCTTGYGYQPYHGMPPSGVPIASGLHHPGHFPVRQLHVQPPPNQLHVQQQQPPPSQHHVQPHVQPPQPSQPQQSTNHNPSTQDQWLDHSNSPGTDGDGKSKKKRKRCGLCPGCIKKDNCNECGPCKSVRSHQICKMRKCDQLKTKKEKARENAQLAAAAQAAAAGITSLTAPAKESNSSRSRGVNKEVSSPPARANNPIPTPGFQPVPTDGQPNRDLKREYDGNSFQAQHQHGNPRNSPPQQTQVDNGNWNNNNNDGNSNGGCTNSAAERHQMLSSKLKTLIQNRQSTKHTTINGNGTDQGVSEPYYGSTIFVSAAPGISGSNLTYTNGSVSEHNTSMDIDYVNSQLDNSPPSLLDLGSGTLVQPLESVSLSSSATSTALPPMSSFLLPSFRESWWDGPYKTAQEPDQRECINASFLTSLSESN